MVESQRNARFRRWELCSPEPKVVKASVGVGILNKCVEELLERLVDGRRGHGRLQAAGGGRFSEVEARKGASSVRVKNHLELGGLAGE